MSASLLDSDFTGRLDTHTAAATVNTVALVSYMVATVQSCVPAFASNARRHLRTADKRLLLKAEELDGAKKAFLVLLQHATSGEDTDELLKELGDVIARSLDSLDGFSPTSTMLAFSCVETLEQISECSSIDIGIDVSRSSISHAPWLTRGERSNVVITVVDAVGEALPGLTAEDVCTSVDSDAVGWEVSSVSVWSNYVSLWITLAPDCSDTVSVTARIVDTRFLIPLKVSL